MGDALPSAGDAAFLLGELSLGDPKALAELTNGEETIFRVGDRKGVAKLNFEEGEVLEDTNLLGVDTTGNSS